MLILGPGLFRSLLANRLICSWYPARSRVQFTADSRCWPTPEQQVDNVDWLLLCYSMSIILHNGWCNYYENAIMPFSRIISLFRIGTCTVTVTNLYNVSVSDIRSSSKSYLWEMNRLNLPRYVVESGLLTILKPWPFLANVNCQVVETRKGGGHANQFHFFGPHVLISARYTFMSVLSVTKV